jgi:Domain of unknown function (DUF4249)
MVKPMLCNRIFCNFIWLVFGAFLLLTACDSSLTGDLDLDYVGDKLTITGFLSPKEIWLKVGKTVPSSQSHKLRELLSPEGTVVMLLDSAGRTIVNLTSNNRWIYTTKSQRLAVGQSYRIRVSAPGFTDAETDLITIPEPVEVAFEPMQNISGANGPGGQLDFSFMDNGTIRNFYYADFGVTKGNLMSKVAFWVINPEFQGKCFSIYPFSDNCFNGRRATLQYGFDKTFNLAPGPPLADTLRLRFGPVTHHFFEGNKQYLDQDAFISGLNEPLPTYTNIKNGYGVVFGQNWKEYLFKL